MGDISPIIPPAYATGRNIQEVEEMRILMIINGDVIG
jgi:hypothetical protein